REAMDGRTTVQVGVRPEHLSLKTAAADCELTGAIEVVEPLGALTMIQVAVGDAVLTAEIESHQQVRIGETVTLSCRPDRLYLFDPETGMALSGIDTSV